MFYEERVINGVLCYRTNSKREFKPMTVEMLTARIQEKRETNQVLKKQNAELVEFIKGTLSYYNATPDEWDNLESILGSSLPPAEECDCWKHIKQDEDGTFCSKCKTRQYVKYKGDEE